MQEATQASFSGGETDVYRSVSRAAIASVLLSALGLAGFWLMALAVLPLLGLVFGMLAVRDFRRFPDEIVGRPIAVFGIALALCLVVAVPTFHGVIYLTEVPEGYTRTDFNALLAPKTRDQPTKFALSINGEKIFIKGYIHPASMDTLRAKKFVLVPDLGTCCFGGQPPLTHMIEVSLSGDQYATKGFRKQRLAGTLKVASNLKRVDGLTGVYYQLDADILK